MRRFGDPIGEVAAWVTGDPNGEVSAPAGAIAVDIKTGTMYQNTDGASTWVVFASGGSPSASGAYLGRQIITSTGIYTPTTGTTNGIVSLQAAGGGGGGVAAATAGWGAGGGSGVFWQKKMPIVAGGAATIGAGGTGTTGNGNAGGDTSIVIDGVTYTAKGGAGGGGNKTTDFVTSTAGGSVASSTAGYDIAWSRSSSPGRISAGNGGINGRGGDSMFGATGQLTGIGGGAGNNGNSGSGYGAGGNGAVNDASGSDRTGGNGQPGVIVIDEYR